MKDITKKTIENWMIKDGYTLENIKNHTDLSWDNVMENLTKEFNKARHFFGKEYSSWKEFYNSWDGDKIIETVFNGKEYFIKKFKDNDKVLHLIYGRGITIGNGIGHIFPANMICLTF